MDESSTSLLFKKGQQGLYVSFSQGLGRPDQSAVDYTANRLTANVPFPDDATNILYDERRPYLSCFTAAPVEASLDFFRKALVAAGWLPLSAADAAADWPHAVLDDKVANGARAYFSYANADGGYRQPPIMLSLRRRDDGRTSVDIRVAPFALPQNLAVARESAGLPVPDHTPSSQSSGDSGLGSPHRAGSERGRYSRRARVLSPRTRGAGLEGRGQRLRCHFAMKRCSTFPRRIKPQPSGLARNTT